jgi:hypothetical protein
VVVGERIPSCSIKRPSAYGSGFTGFYIQLISGYSLRRFPIVKKQNCWEVKKCGRIKGGAHEHDQGICPASNEKRLDGVHGGKNAGRACWVVAGTFCDGKVQGTFAAKYGKCETCAFYQAVKKEEGTNYEMSIVLLSKMR